MAQFAVHVATGIYSGDLIKDNFSIKFALIIGNILPDLDFIPMLLIYPFNSELALNLHRSFTHNFFLPLLILGVLTLVSFIKHNDRLRSWGLGLAIGISTHIIFDVLFWFDQVKVFWPLDIWGISSNINFWGWIRISVPVTVALLVSPTLEFLMYALFFYYFGRRIQKQTKNKHTKFFPGMVIISLVVYFCLVIGVFFLPAKLIVELSYGLGAIIWAPLTMYTVWKFRNSLFAKTPN